jgi:broad specificity phosphatase PhoE
VQKMRFAHFLHNITNQYERRRREQAILRGEIKLRRLLGYIKSIVIILWIALVVTGRFWRWRLELWRHPERLMESRSDSMKRTLLFIRHGQTRWNVERILPGQLSGVELTGTGREQAERLSEALKVLPITAVISSPLERARDTAAYISGPHNLPVLIEDDLMDTDIGHWAGKKVDELNKSDSGWKEYVRDPTKAPEGIESFAQVQQRSVAAVERWLGQGVTGDYPAFVAHADVVKLILAYYMGLEAARAGWLSIDNASVSIVKLHEERSPRIVAIGWSPRPGWLKPPVQAEQ